MARGFIRVDADEMTYPAHIMVRFELEQALIAGRPRRGRTCRAHGTTRSIVRSGLVPPDDALGCLQDIHWYDGAVRLFSELHVGRDGGGAVHGGGRGEMRRRSMRRLGGGDFGPLLDWLRTRVHSQGSRLGFNDLLLAATGKPLDPADFEAHLAARYLA